jgi:hypothetical protein
MYLPLNGRATTMTASSLPISFFDTRGCAVRAYNEVVIDFFLFPFFEYFREEVAKAESLQLVGTGQPRNTISQGRQNPCILRLSLS